MNEWPLRRVRSVCTMNEWSSGFLKERKRKSKCVTPNEKKLRPMQWIVHSSTRSVCSRIQKTYVSWQISRQRSKKKSQRLAVLEILSVIVSETVSIAFCRSVAPQKVGGHVVDGADVFLPAPRRAEGDRQIPHLQITR